MIKEHHGNQTADCTDGDLSLRLQGGDSDAFVELASRYMPLIRSRASSFRQTALETDDLCQEGLLGLLNAARTYNPRANASFKTYAGVCIGNRIIMAHRRAASKKNQPLNNFVSLSGGEEGVSLPADSALVNPEVLLAADEELSSLKMKMKQALSKMEQRVLFLYLGGCSYREISAQLGITEKAADNALQRVRKKLQSV